jgi:hypothetical protein
LNTLKIKTWLTDKSTVRLLSAILISALLHFGLIHQFQFLGLPETKTKTQLIEARLVQPKAETLPKEVSAKQITPSAPTKYKKVAPKKIQPKPEVITESAPVTEVQPPKKDEPPKAELAQINEDDTEKQMTEIAEASQAHLQPAIAENEPDIPIEKAAEEPKPAPYVMVETDFNIYVNSDNGRAGTAKITYHALQNIQRYELKWEVNATGLLALFYPDLVQTSQGLITEKGLRPEHYIYQLEKKDSKATKADFDWINMKVNLLSNKGEKVADISDATQDVLSFMYQFMYIPPLSQMRVNMANGKKVADYDYVFEGEESLELPFANLKTYHIKHFKTDSDEKTELWLAKDYHFVPVKIRKTEENGTVIEQVATNLKTETLIEETPLP